MMAVPELNLICCGNVNCDQFRRRILSLWPIQVRTKDGEIKNL